MLKTFCSKSGGILVVKTFTKNGTKITNYALLESKTCNKTIVKAEEIIFCQHPRSRKLFFSPQPLSVEKLVQNWYKNGTIFGTKSTVPIPISRFSAAPKS